MTQYGAAFKPGRRAVDPLGQGADPEPMSEPIRDIYDRMDPNRGVELRRRNQERLAELEATGTERRNRLGVARDTTVDERGGG